jgi:probable rRNA maturation factor
MAVLVSRVGLSGRAIPSASLRTRAERILLALRLPGAELSVVVCDDPTIHQLNRDHRKKDKPTDVLAFAQREGKPVQGTRDLLGDVVISLETAQRQADEHGRSLWDEVTMLLAHGLLHLVGFDHRTRAEERIMNARADVLVAAAQASRPKAPASGSKAKRTDVDKRRRGIEKRPAPGTRVRVKPHK